MITEIEKCIGKLCTRMQEDYFTADEALKFTQAVTNLANARATIICSPVDGDSDEKA